MTHEPWRRRPSQEYEVKMFRYIIQTMTKQRAIDGKFTLDDIKIPDTLNPLAKTETGPSAQFRHGEIMRILKTMRSCDLKNQLITAANERAELWEKSK